MGRPGGGWCGAVEGYYGTPLTHQERLDLVAWLGAHGMNAYAYAPKNDPYHRDRWRDPYPVDRMAEFAEVVSTGNRHGVMVGFTLSPGLDWRDGDEDVLIAKLRAFADLGAPLLGVAWDDVPPGEADLGLRHGSAVAAAVEAIGREHRWVTCPTDYATSVPTPYLTAFVNALPAAVDVMWTGPSIVSPEVTAEQASDLGAALGRPLLFAENFPVNDGLMGAVLHLGPYPVRPAGLVEATAGVFCNFMSLPIASRVGLGVASRFWNDPGCDREAAWTQVIGEFPGLEPLARASRNWADGGDPDAVLLEWARAALEGDERLLLYLQAGCREGLDPGLAAEIEPWLDQWDKESHAMQFALKLLSAAGDHRPAELAFATATLWERARSGREQLFGVRFAGYPLTARERGELVALPRGIVRGENLTDRLCSVALGLSRDALS